MPTTIDFGELGEVQVPPELTSEDQINQFGRAQYQQLKANAGRQYARGVTSGDLPMPEGLRYLLPNFLYPPAAGLSRGVGGLVQAPQYMVKLLADLPYEAASSWGSPATAERVYRDTQGLRDTAEAMRQTTAPLVEKLDLPAYSQPTFGESYAEKGALGGAEYFGEKLAENVPQLASMLMGGALMKGMGMSVQQIAKWAPWMVFPLEAQGAMEEQIQRTGTYSPRSALAVGTLNSLIERFGTGKLLHQVLGESGLSVVPGAGAMARQIGGRALNIFGREGAQEVGQEAVTMNVPPLISDQPTIPFEDQVGRMTESFFLGGFLGAPLSVGSDVVDAAQNRYLWDADMQGRIRQQIAGEAAHRIASRRAVADELAGQQLARQTFADYFTDEQDALARQEAQYEGNWVAHGANVASGFDLNNPQTVAHYDELREMRRLQAERDAAVHADLSRQRAEQIGTALQAIRSGELSKIPYSQDAGGIPILGTIGMDPIARPVVTPAITGNKPVGKGAELRAPLQKAAEARDAQWNKTVDAIKKRMAFHLVEAEKAKKVAAELALREGDAAREAVEQAKRQTLFHQGQIDKAAELVGRAEASRRALEAQEAEDARAQKVEEPKVESKKAKAARESTEKLMQGVADMLERMATGRKPKRPKNALSSKSKTTTPPPAPAAPVPTTTTTDVLGRAPVAPPAQPAPLVPQEPPPAKPPRKLSSNALKKGAAKVVAGLKEGAGNALRAAKFVLKKTTQPRESRAVKKEAGNRFEPAKSTVRFYALMKDIMDKEKDPETRKVYEEILKQFTGIAEKVENKFNLEPEVKVSRAASSRVGGDTASSKEQTARQEFLSENHNMIQNHVEGNFASLFEDIRTEAEGIFGKPEDKQGAMADNVRRDTAKHIQEKLLEKFSLNRAYQYARGKALGKSASSPDLNRESPKARNKRLEDSRKLAEANKKYHAKRNPWASLSLSDSRSFMHYLINLFNGLPLIERHGVDPIPLGATAAEIMSIEPLEPYEEYKQRTKDALDKFIRLIKRGDSNVGFRNSIFLLVADQPTQDRIKNPPDIEKEAAKGWDAVTNKNKTWSPLTPEQQAAWSKDLTESFGEAVALQFRSRDQKDFDEKIDSRFSLGDPSLAVGNIALEGWRDSLDAAVPANPASPMFVDDLLAVLDQLFGKDNRPTNISVGTNKSGAVAEVRFSTQSGGRQRIRVDLNLAKSREDLLNRVSEEILHTVYDKDSPMFRRAIQAVNQKLYKEMQDIYFNTTFQDSYARGKAGGLTGEALLRYAYDRTHGIVEEEAAIRVLIAEAKKAKPSPFASQFWTAITTAIRNLFGLRLTPREAALLMEMSVNRFAEHEIRWQERRLREAYELAEAEKAGTPVQEGEVRSSLEGARRVNRARPDPTDETDFVDPEVPPAQPGVQTPVAALPPPPPELQTGIEFPAGVAEPTVEVPEPKPVSVETRSPSPETGTSPVQAAPLKDEETRFSMARGHYSSVSAVQTDMDYPGADKDTISDASRQQGWLTPGVTEDMINLWGSDHPSVTLAQRVASRYLRPIRDQGKLKRNLPRITPMTDTLPDTSRNYGASMIINQNQANRDLLKHLEDVVTTTMEKYQDVASEETERMIKSADAEAFGAEANRFVRNYTDLISAQARLAKTSGDMGQAAELLEASGKINAFRKANVIPLASALKNAAMQIPESELVDSGKTAAWIRSRQLDKTQPPLMSDEVFSAITTPVGRRRTAPLESYTGLHLRLAKVKKIVANGEKEAAEVAKLKAEINPKTGRTSIPSFAKRHSELMIARKEAMDTFEMMSADFSKAKRKYEAAQLAYDTVHEMLEHPEYTAVLNDAVLRINARAWGTMGEETDNTGKQHYGRTWFLNPRTNKKVYVDLSTDKAAATENLETVTKLRDDIREWLVSNSARIDPILKNTWVGNLDMIDQWMVAVGKPTFVGTTIVPGLNVPALSTTFQNVFRLLPGVRKYFVTLRNLAHEMGGMGMARVNRIMAAMDAFEAYNQAHDDREFDIDDAIYEALKARGMATTGENQHLYRVMVFDPIVSQHQTPTSRAFKVGESAYGGFKVIQQDLDAAKIQTVWIDGLYKFLQAQGYKTQGLEPNDAEFIVRSLMQDPLLNEDPDAQWSQSQLTSGDTPKRLEGRRGIAYGFKAPRVKNKQGNAWASRWFDALKADQAATAARPEAQRNDPEIIQARLALFDDPDFFRNTVLGMMVETNDQFQSTYRKENKDTRNQIVDEFRRGAADTKTFDGITSLFGGIESDRKMALGADPVTEAQEFARRVVEHIDDWMPRYSEKAKDDTSLIGQAGRRADISVVGHNPFSKERGMMVAPSTYYKYSMADQRSRMQLQEQVMIQFRSAMIEALSSAEAAIDRDYQKAYTDLVRSSEPDPNRIKLFSKGKSIKWRRRAAVTKGEANRTIGQLLDAKRAMQRIRTDFERLNKERAEETMDDYGLRLGRKLTQTPIIGVLTGFSPAINNIMQGTHAAMSLSHALGNGGMLAPLPEGLRFVMTVLSTIAHQIKIPLLGDLVRMWEYELTDPETSNAMSQGLGREWNTMRRGKTAFNYPHTGGVSSADPEENSLIGKVVSIPGIHQVVGATNTAWQAFIRTLPGEIENAFNLALLIHTRKQINRYNAKFLNYVRAEAASGPGWEARLIAHPDTTDRALRAGAPSDSSVKTIRHVLQEAGSLEQLLISYHERTKNMSFEEAARQPFLEVGQYIQAAQTVARDFNKRSPSGDLQSFVGKGFTGFIRSMFGTFVRAPAQASHATGIYTGTVPGETESFASRSFRFTKLGAGLMVLAMGGLELRQALMELLYMSGRTVRSPQDIQTPGQMASYTAAMMSPWGSTLPALVQQSTGDVSVRPILDATEMNIAAGLFRDLNRSLIEMIQTGNVTQSAGDLIERYFPLTRIVSARSSMLRSGEPEVTAASRDLRFAAPPGVEIRRFGGGGGGSNKTPLSPIIRKLSQAVGANDTEEIDRLMEEAVQMQVDNGYSPKEARLSVQKSLAARSPIQRAFPRRLSQGETEMTYSALRPEVRSRVGEIQGRFDSLTRKPKVRTGSTSSKRKKRSALRSKRRRSSLSAPSFSYV